MTDVPFNNDMGDVGGLGWSHAADQQTVIFRCRNNHRLGLFNPEQPSPRHGIAEDGTVDGSVVCGGQLGIGRRAYIGLLTSIAMLIAADIVARLVSK